MGEVGVRNGQAVAANQAIEASIDRVRVVPIVRVLQNHFRAGAPDLKRSGLQVHATGKPDLVHLKPDAILQPYALLECFGRFPSLNFEQG